MKKYNLILAVCSLMLLNACKDEEAPALDYPFTVVFKGAENKTAIMGFQNNAGEVSDLPLSETDLDEDEFFTDLETEGSFDEIIFNSATSATMKSAGDLVIGDEGLTINYEWDIENDQLNFDINFGAFSFNVVGNGTPESFTIPSQVYAEEIDNSSVSTQQYIQEEIESFKNNMEDGAKLVVQNYDQIYGR